MNAVKIAMRANAENSNNPKDIEYIFILFNENIIKKYDIIQLYDILIEDLDKRIYIYNSNAYLVPTRATNGKKYIRSTPSTDMIDELMKLPRC